MEGIYTVKNGIKSYKAYIGGRWIESRSKQTITAVSPIDGKPFAEIQALSKQECVFAIKFAKEKQEEMKALPAVKRAKILNTVADLLMEEKKLFTDLLVKEIGKPLQDAESEVERTADSLRFCAEEGKRIFGESMFGDSVPDGTKKKLGIICREPIGTVLAIAPSNYPLNLASAKIGPAFAAGNTVVLKPPTQGSIVGLHFAELFRLAGLPDGALNVVTGKGSEIGDALVTHPDINMISFTGSAETGEAISKKAGMVRLSMELGGKDPMIVLEDADLEKAVKAAVSGAFSFAGERCTAVKRVLVHEKIKDQFMKRLVAETKKVKHGDPSKTGIDVGPLFDKPSADKVRGLIDEAVAKGAKIKCGGKNKGLYFEPTILDNVSLDMQIAWVEQFGPVLPVIKVKSLDEAIKIANKSEYGLQADVFTNDINKAFYAAFKLEAGTVQINGKSSRGPDHFPFGGVKHSGIGREGIKYAVEEMTQIKAIVLNL